MLFNVFWFFRHMYNIWSSLDARKVSNLLEQYLKGLGKIDPRCKHHVYVAAALMEYYCTKDKNIAFRIFELGLKKFGDNPDYILCYIDYLSHLNGKTCKRIFFKVSITLSLSLILCYRG